MGTLYVKNFKVDMKPSLMNYMKRGWVLNCSIAIDFTLSNGDPRSPESLHYMDPNRN